MKVRRRKLIRSSIIFGSIAISIFLFLGIAWNRGRYLEGVVQSPRDLEMDNETLVLADAIPPMATDIHYCAHPYFQKYEASFHITENEFLQWAHKLELSALIETNAHGQAVQPSKLEAIADDEMPSMFYENKDKRNDGSRLNPGYFLPHIKSSKLRSVTAAYSISDKRAYLKIRR